VPVQYHATGTTGLLKRTNRGATSSLGPLIRGDSATGKADALAASKPFEPYLWRWLPAALGGSIV